MSTTINRILLNRDLRLASYIILFIALLSFIGRYTPGYVTMQVPSIVLNIAFLYFLLGACRVDSSVPRIIGVGLHFYLGLYFILLVYHWALFGQLPGLPAIYALLD